MNWIKNLFKPFSKDNLLLKEPFEFVYCDVYVREVDFPILCMIREFKPSWEDQTIPPFQFGELTLGHVIFRYLSTDYLKKKEPIMLNELFMLFKENTYQEMSTISQIMGAILNTFAKEKFVNGDSDRDAAIDALCKLLQSHKSTTTK